MLSGILIITNISLPYVILPYFEEIHYKYDYTKNIILWFEVKRWFADMEKR